MDFRYIFIIFVLFFSIGTAAAWDNISGGDHGGIDWTPSNLTTIGGVHTNITTFMISNNYIIYIEADNELEIYADIINIVGTVNGNGKGNTSTVGDSDGGNGSWTTGASQDSAGGGGAGHGSSGAAGGNGYFGSLGGTAGALYGINNTISIDMGFIGGKGGNDYSGSKAPGGLGGGSVLFSANATISISGTIQCNGMAGSGGGYQGGGGGGGSGGGVILISDQITVTGSIYADGGNGGSGNNRGGGGGGGSGGRVKIANVSAVVVEGTISIDGGSGGASGQATAGTDGTDGNYTTFSIARPITTALYTDNAVNPTQSTNFTPLISWTYAGDYEQTTYEIHFGTTLGGVDMWNSGVVSSPNNYTTYAGSTLARNTTYFVQVRTEDSFFSSDWATGTFKINALPIVSNVTISPIPASTDVNLTANNDTALDVNNDDITLYYRWYVNDTLETEFNDLPVIPSANTASGQIWKVGIIPFDSYENGTQVNSSTVTIDSPNTAPTLTGIETNSIKYGYTATVNTTDAYDVDNDNYRLSVGTSSGLSDICNSSSTENGTEASCSFVVSWTSGDHTLYARLTDDNDTSAEYTTAFTVDTTPPTISNMTVSTSGATIGDTITITANIAVEIGTVEFAKVSIQYPSGSIANSTMTGTAGTYTTTFTPTSAGIYYLPYFYATDDSGNEKTQSSTLAILVSTASTDGTGGSSSSSSGDTYVSSSSPTYKEVAISEPTTETKIFVNVVNFITYIFAAMIGAILIQILMGFLKIEGLSLSTTLLFGLIGWLSASLLNVIFNVFQTGEVTSYILFVVFGAVAAAAGYVLLDGKKGKTKIHYGMKL